MINEIDINHTPSASKSSLFQNGTTPNLDINICILTGKIDSDIRFAQTKHGTRAMSFNLKVSREVNSVNYSSWYSVSSFDEQLIDSVEALTLGDIVCIEGSVVIRTWEDQTGQKQKKYEISAKNISLVSNNSTCQGADVNFVMIQGKVDRVPSVNMTKNNNKAVSFTLLVNRLVNIASENKMFESWFNIASFSNNVTSLAANLKQGDRVQIQGSLNRKAWTDTNNQKHIQYEIKADNMLVLSANSGVNEQFSNDNLSEYTSQDQSVDHDIPDDIFE